MAYSASWVDQAQRVVDVLHVVDPIMGQELVQAGDLIAANPFACGAPAFRPFTIGKQ